VSRSVRSMSNRPRETPLKKYYTEKGRIWLPNFLVVALSVAREDPFDFPCTAEQFPVTLKNLFSRPCETFSRDSAFFLYFI